MGNLALKREKPHFLNKVHRKYEETDDALLLEGIFEKTKNARELSMEDIIDEISVARREREI